MGGETTTNHHHKTTTVAISAETTIFKLSQHHLNNNNMVVNLMLMHHLLNKITEVIHNKATLHHHRLTITVNHNRVDMVLLSRVDSVVSFNKKIIEKLNSESISRKYLDPNK